MDDRFEGRRVVAENQFHVLAKVQGEMTSKLGND